jgi:hypothetical protein
MMTGRVLLGIAWWLAPVSIAQAGEIHFTFGLTRTIDACEQALRFRGLSLPGWFGASGVPLALSPGGGEGNRGERRSVYLPFGLGGPRAVRSGSRE